MDDEKTPEELAREKLTPEERAKAEREFEKRITWNEGDLVFLNPEEHPDRKKEKSE